MAEPDLIYIRKQRIARTIVVELKTRDTVPWITPSLCRSGKGSHARALTIITTPEQSFCKFLKAYRNLFISNLLKDESEYYRLSQNSKNEHDWCDLEFRNVFLTTVGLNSRSLLQKVLC